MAQTKTKPKAKSKSKSKAKSKPKASSSKNKAGQQSSRARPKKAGRAQQRRKATQSPLDKLKGPATATGAALLAVAGGLAATRGRNGHGRRRKLVKSLKRIDLPSADAAIDWVEKRATDVGDAADKAEQMTSTARKVKKALS